VEQRIQIRTRALAAALVCACAALALAAVAKDKVDYRAWITGPVRYITIKDEVKAFKSLESDEARILFVEKFWARRDPSPNTLANETRQIFWERVNEANNHFTDSSKPGWKTDRGKIHILYGPPTDIQEDLYAYTADGITGGGHGIVRWIYEGRPGQRRDMDAVVVVPFVRDGSGEYRQSNDPNLASLFFDANALREAKYDLGARMRASNAGMGRSTLSVMLDLGKLQEVPPQEQVLIERVETAEAYQNEPVRVLVDRYLQPASTQTVLAITIDLSNSSDEARPAMMARLSPRDAPGGTRILGEDSFRLDERYGHRVAQARLTVDSGDYRLTVMVADPVRVTTALHQGDVVVPEPSQRMRFSGVTLASELEALPYRSLASYDEPYIVGAFRVVPKMDDLFKQGDTVRLFYEVYGATEPYQVSYQLEGQENDGNWVGLGQPSVAEQSGRSQGWELPTGTRWPLGAYRVRVEITDAEGKLISTDLPFRLGLSEAS